MKKGSNPQPPDGARKPSPPPAPPLPWTAAGAYFVKSIDGAITEMRAGEVLVPKNEMDKAWNDASERAVTILQRYKEGLGLFQL